VRALFGDSAVEGSARVCRWIEEQCTTATELFAARMSLLDGRL
jgi:hypothetical protein